jgi:natural resistance-associated macrophage protein 2
MPDVDEAACLRLHASDEASTEASACRTCEGEHLDDVLDTDEGEEFGRNGFTLRELWKFFGPAWIVSIAYLDPGNLETDLQAGAQFGYSLTWVLLWSSVLGLVIQILALRLGIVSRRHLAQHCRDEYPKAVRYVLWVLAELMIVAVDVPEVIGTAFAIQILSNHAIPLYGGVLLCSASTVLFLGMSQLGGSFLNCFIGLLVFIMSACFVMECVMSPPDLAGTLSGALYPRLPGGAEAVAVGIVGAVAMPHNLFLQSALVLEKSVRRERRSLEFACLYTSVETGVALGASFLINACVLLVAASSFAPLWCPALEQVCEGGSTECAAGGAGADSENGCFPVGLETAGNLLEKTVGNRAEYLWAIALLASGQSSTITGTLAGQFVMEGFVEMTLPRWARNLTSRLMAIVPSLVVALLAGAKGANNLIVAASVVCALHLPLAMVPLLKMTDSPLKMGRCRNSPVLSFAAWMLTGVVLLANMSLVWSVVMAPLLSDASAHAPLLALWSSISVLYFMLLGLYLSALSCLHSCTLAHGNRAGSRVRTYT